MKKYVVLGFALIGVFMRVSANGCKGAEAPSYSYYIRQIDDTYGGYAVMLPISGVLNEYADISIDETGVNVKVTCGTLDAEMEIGKTPYVINGETAELDAPPEIIDGEIYVPSTFFSKTFGTWTMDTGEGVIDLFIPGHIIENI